MAEQILDHMNVDTLFQEMGRGRVLWSDDADRDLVSIWEYGADTWSPAQADHHLREIKRICDGLIRTPELGKARDELTPGIRAILINPHVAFYRLTATAVEIVRVLHQSEDVEIIFH
jgi:toxin ParE1/3/4